MKGDGWMDKRQDGHKKGWMDKRKCEWLNGWIKGRMDGGIAG